MSKRARVAVVLSGCGYQDGTEITEAVCTLIALSESSAEAVCYAPNITFQTRNALEESARIARGQVQPLSELREADFDAIVFPGGFGAAKVLSNWAERGAKCDLIPDVRKAIVDFHAAAKPIGAICIAPALIARALGRKSVSVTIGEDSETAAEIERTGAKHVKCAVDDYISDRDHKVLTTPAYMYEAPPPHLVFEGIRRLVRELVEMA